MSASVKQHRTGTAVRERGQERVADIIAMAQKIFIQEGLASLSVRRVAKELGISVGNLSYYFSTKESLLQAIIEDVISGYDEELAQESQRFPDAPPMRFKAFIRYLIEDAKKPDVRGFFYQFWGLSTHNRLAANSREQMYQHFVEQTTDLLTSVNPELEEAELKVRTLLIINALEGLHVILGSGEKFLKQFADLEEHIYRQILTIAGIE